ncbi:MAG: putative membrane protein YeiB, partial [Planctomycetota bacterium]
AVGRVSLSHYLMHTVVVYGALRHWWPDENWSLGVGLTTAIAYAALALLVTPWWLASGRRGPVEAMLALCAGRRTR